MRESNVKSYHKVIGTAIVSSDGGVGLLIHYAAFIDGENECCEPDKPVGLSAEVWKDSRVRIGKVCLIHAKKLIRESIQVDQMETELASDPTDSNTDGPRSLAYTPPLVEPGRLDPKHLPTEHPDRAPGIDFGSAAERISDLAREGHSIGEAYKIVKGNPPIPSSETHQEQP